MLKSFKSVAMEDFKVTMTVPLAGTVLSMFAICASHGSTLTFSHATKCNANGITLAGFWVCTNKYVT